MGPLGAPADATIAGALVGVPRLAVDAMPPGLAPLMEGVTAAVRRPPTLAKPVLVAITRATRGAAVGVAVPLTVPTVPPIVAT